MFDFLNKMFVDITIGDFMLLCIYVKLIFSIRFKLFEINFNDDECRGDKPLHKNFKKER